MSEMTVRTENRNRSEQMAGKTLAQRFAAFLKETKAWYDELSRKTGYRYPVTF